MKSEQDNEPVEVFAGTPWQAGLVKSLIENAEIEAFLLDDIMGTLYPWYTSSGGFCAVKVIVAGHDYESAKSIVDEFMKTL